MTKDKNLGQKLKTLGKYKYLILLIIVGIVLILLPTGGDEFNDTSVGGSLDTPSFSVETQEVRLEEILGRVEGAGSVKVMLSLKSSVERELAQSQDEALVVSAGSGKQTAVERRFIYPEYQGAVIICEGADSAAVKLSIVEAVQSITGLGSDKITVIKSVSGGA